MNRSAGFKLLFLLSVFSQTPHDWFDISSSSFPLLQGFPKREKTIKQTIANLLSAGLLEYQEKRKGLFIRLTKKAYQQLTQSYPFYQQYLASWDKKLRLVFYHSIPERERSKRDALRWLLQSFHFLPLSKSLWATPHNLTNQLSEKLNKAGLSVYVKMLEAKISYGHLANLFKLNKLNSQYQQLNYLLEKTIKQVKNKRRQIAIFRQAFLTYQKLIKEDPGLPSVFLPKNWSGLQARKNLIKLQKML